MTKKIFSILFLMTLVSLPLSGVLADGPLGTDSTQGRVISNDPFSSSGANEGRVIQNGTINGSGSSYNGSGVYNGGGTFDNSSSGGYLRYGDTTSGGGGLVQSGQACSNEFGTIQDFINYVGCVLGRSVLPLLIGFAVLFFVIGVVRYVIAPDGSNDREAGRKFMIYGVIGLFVIVAMWGLVGVLVNTFGVSTTSVFPQF